jgi:hypothetical protein
MDLTIRQLAILNHVVDGGQEWADNAIKEAHVLEKIARHQASYDEAVANGGYKTRKQRDEEEKQSAEQAKIDKYENAPWDAKRRLAYAKINQYEMQFDDQRDGTTTWVDAINAIKAAHPKP